MWEHINQCFPLGIVPGNDQLTSQQLINNKSESVDCLLNEYARDMLVKQERIIWYANGDMAKETVYDIQGNTSLNMDSCLNVYGNKMLIDWYDRKQFEPLREVQQIKYGGFNYTGI